MVKRVESGSLTLTDDSVVPFGLCIWSTGVGPTPFTLSLPFAKTKVGRIAVGAWQQLWQQQARHQLSAGAVLWCAWQAGRCLPSARRLNNLALLLLPLLCACR